MSSARARHRTRRRAPRAPDRPGGPRSVAAAVVLAAAVALLLLSAPAVGDDADPPTFANGTAVNDTVFEVVVVDDAGVDESSITAGDFSLNRGAIEGIGVRERGNDSVVSVRLVERLPQNDVTLRIANGGSIADDAGNAMTEGSVTVTGMDGYPPYLQSYSLHRPAESTLQIEFYTNERIHNTSVVVSGPERRTFGPEDFEETDTRTPHEFRYRANYSLVTEGEYQVTLEWIADDNANRAVYYADRTTVHDATRPQAQISGPASAILGQSVTFDANRSHDDRAVVRYRWTIDGNVTGTNETVSHAFNESGRHEVTLTVADGRNNTDTAVTTVDVLDVTTTRDVTITPRDGRGVDVTIGPNRTKRRVLVERSGHLAANGSVSLDSLTLSVPTNATANLSTSASDDAPASFAVAEQVGFGAFDVSHGGAQISDVTFRFTVERAALDDAEVPPEGMSLYREQGTDWDRLPALRVGGNDTHVEYRATSPGLSRFVVAGSNASDAGTADEEGAASTDTGAVDGEGASEDQASAQASPAFAVVDAELLTHNVSAGDPVVARATVANDGNTTGTYLAGLSIDGAVVGTSEVTVPAGERREVTVAVPIDSGGPASLNGTRLGVVSVGGGAVSTDGGGGGGLSVPNPLSLWPGGLFGRALGAIFWIVVIVYAILKSLAIHLGY